MHYLLTYELAPDYLERRPEFRDEHLRRAWESQRAGEMILAGAMDDPVDTALLLFNTPTPEPALLFAATDPYVINGLVKSFQVRPWKTVVGDLATTPVHPAGDDPAAEAPQTTFFPS